MKRTNTLILIVLLGLILFIPQQGVANISKGKQYQYLWTRNSNSTIEGETLYTTKQSAYLLEIMYIEENRLGVKEVSAGNLRFNEYEYVSKDSSSLYYPDYRGQTYFLNKDDFETFYTNWIDEGSENQYMVQCSAENRVFTYSEKKPDYDDQIGSNNTDPEASESIYDNGEYTRKIRCEYTRDGVLSYLEEEDNFKGAISDFYHLDVLTLTDTKLGNNIPFLLISCSLVIISSIYLIFRKRRIGL